MLRPECLHPKDEIRILTTARKVSEAEISESRSWLESLGYTVTYGCSIGLENYQYGGSDEERALDFQKALDDINVKAIWFARGGYGSVRIFDAIQWDNFIQNPKWLIGFSDITIWHNLVNQFYGIQTVHSIMPLTWSNSSEQSKILLSEIIEGKYSSILFNYNLFNKNFHNIEGEIIGGNLSILYSLIGTKSGFNTNGKILFIEEIDEYLYHIDRMMISLKHAGKLAGLKGLIVGGFTDIKDNSIPFGKGYQDIILEHASEYGYPIIFDFPAGHIEDNCPIVLGAKVKFHVEGNQIQMSYE